jgi:hypothetical protein
MLRSWNFLLLLLVGWSLPGALQAQSDNSSRSLEDRLLRPDVHRQQPLQIRRFEDPRQMTVREFSDSKSFQTATATAFAGQRYETPRFLGIKIPFLPKRPVDTPAYANAMRALPVENSPLAQISASEQNQRFAAATRRSEANERAVPVRRATVEGTNQRNLAPDRQMSTEEVRSLLNKPL